VRQFFVTASGTGVGKTLVAAALCRQLVSAGESVRALKPVISGYTPETAAGSDTAILLDSLGASALNSGTPLAAATERAAAFRFRLPGYSTLSCPCLFICCNRHRVNGNNWEIWKFDAGKQISGESGRLRQPVDTRLGSVAPTDCKGLLHSMPKLDYPLCRRFRPN
jgi:hypothetical protein